MGRADDQEKVATLAGKSLDESLQYFFDEVPAMHEYLLSFEMPDGSRPPWPTPDRHPVSLARLASRRA